MLDIVGSKIPFAWTEALYGTHTYVPIAQIVTNDKITSRSKQQWRGFRV